MPDSSATASAPALDRFITGGELASLIQRAFDEDLGPGRLDVTSQCIIPADARASADVRPRKPGRLCGLALLPRIALGLDGQVQVQCAARDGADASAGDTVATLTGPLRSILAIERTALNFITHLSGIATLTRQYVDAVAGTRAKIYDTRKTIPGLRRLAKYAVACGGGANHRMGLHDAVLIKDNHLASLGRDFGEALTRAIAAARRQKPAPAFIEVEVDTLDQLRIVLQCSESAGGFGGDAGGTPRGASGGTSGGTSGGGVDVVLLDNMAPDLLRQAVAMRDDLAPHIELEASGGVDLSTVQAIAATGVDRIAIGALTHSAIALDVGLDLR